MSQNLYHDVTMERIELTPELIFERISEVGSPPNSTLSFNSRGPDPEYPISPKRRSTNPRGAGPYPATLPRQHLPKTDTENMSRSKPRNGPSPKGYYTLGPDTRSAKHKAEPTNISDYGVAISIKGIKGHPFVILEDKENHRHMVPAPDPSESSDVSSDTNRIPNGMETDGPPKTKSRKSDPVYNDWKEKHNPPDLIKPTYSKTNNVGSKPTNAGSRRVPQTSRSMPYSDKLVKPSEVKAAQKPPSSSALHMRSPRARTSHQRSNTLPGKRSDAAARSRSLSPNRAMAAKPNRSRSMSPPRKSRTKRVDDNNTQPVSSLIGFWETDTNDDPKPQSNTRPSRSLDRMGRPLRSPVAQPRSAERPGSYRSLPRPRSAAEIEVTPDSRKPNLTVSTATAVTKSGTMPAGRYFAITSPAATSPGNYRAHQFSPQFSPLKTSQLSSPTNSSETGISTDEATLNITNEIPRISSRRSQDPGSKTSQTPPTRRFSGKKPKASGVSEEPLMRPSSGNSIFGPSEKKETPKTLARKNWRTAADKILALEEEIVPKVAKRGFETGKPFSKDPDSRKKTTAFADIVNLLKHSAKESASETKSLNLESGPPLRDQSKEAPVVVSKVKVMGPSHQLLKKTRRKRNAKRISTSAPGSRTVSGSEWSESEYSEGESLGFSMRSSADEDEKKRYPDSDTRSLPEMHSPVSFTSDGRSPKRIIFGKITSEDITKSSEHIDGPVIVQPLQKSATPKTVAELQEHIGELRETVRQLQRSANDNLQNYELLNELQNKLRDVEEEKRMLEGEIADGRRTLKDLERRLDRAQSEITELRRNERNDRLKKQQQAKELDDLKTELREMNDALDKARSARADPNEKFQLYEDLQHLRNEYDELLSRQEQRERELLKREDELALVKKALREESDGHDEEVEMMRKLHDEVLARLREELNTLRKENLSAIEARPRLEEQVSLLRGELARLKENRRDVDSWHSSSSSSESEESDSTTSRAKEEAVKNKKLLLQTQKELKESQETAEQLKKDLNFLQRKLNSEQIHGDFDDVHIRKLTSSLDHAKENKKSLESEVAALELQRNTLRGQIKEARTEREDGERTIRGLETEISRLKGKVQELENEVERLKKELLRSRRHLEAQVYDLEHQVEESEKKISDLSAQKSKLEKDVSESKIISSQTLIASVHDLEKKKVGLQTSLASKRTIVVEKELEIGQLSDKLRRLSSNAATHAAKDTLQELEEFKKRSASEIDSLRADVEAKARQLREADRTNLKLQEELRRMDSELEEELKEREATVAELAQAERNLHELEEKIAELKREKEERDREMEKVQGMLSLVEDDKLNLEEKLDLVEEEKLNATRDLRLLKEDAKDKDIELEELKCKIKNIQSEIDAERSKVSELEHHKYVTDMSVSGLKEALEAKYEELGEAEATIRKMQSEKESEDEKQEETLKKLRDVEKQRRLAAKEAEDLTVALSKKVAALDEAQRKLRRLEAQMSDADEANLSAANTRLQLEKQKKIHASELADALEEAAEAKNALATSERNISALENELRTYEERYEAAAGESLQLEKMRRNLAHQLDEARLEANEKDNALRNAENKANRLENKLAAAEEEISKLTNQLQEAEAQRRDAEFKGQDAFARLHEKERDLREADKNLEKLQEQLKKSHAIDDEAKKSLDRLKNQKDEAKKEVIKTREEAERCRMRWQEEKEKVAFLEEKLKLADEALKDEVQQSRDAEQEKSDLKKEIARLRHELEEKNKALVKAQYAIKNIEEKMNNYESSHDQKSLQLLQLKLDKERAEEKIDNLESKMRKDKDKLGAVEDDLYRSQKESEASRNRCEELEDELLQNSKEISSLQNQIKDLKDGIKDIVQEKQKAKETAEQLQKQVELLQLELKERSNWSDRKQEELQSEIQSVEADLRSVEQELNKQLKEKAALQAKLEGVEQNLADKRREADDDLKKEIEQLRNSLDEKTQQIFAAEDTIYRQKEVIEDLTNIQKEAEKSSLEQMDAYMLESDKQFEQLKSHLQEKSDVIDALQQEKESLMHEAELISADMDREKSEAERMRSAYEKEQSRLEELEQLLKELRNRLKQEQKDNSELREQVSANLRNQSQEVDSDDDSEKTRLHGLLEESRKKLEESENERVASLNKLEVLQDKFGQLNNELEMERSQVELLQKDTLRQKQEIDLLHDELEKRSDSSSSDSDDDEKSLIASLREQIASLEEKLEQEANELNSINTHHHRTEIKLREVLKQAENESIKANSEKEMMNMRIKALKDQLQETENQLLIVEENRRHLHEELREQTDLNFDLKQALSRQPAPGNLFTSV